MLIQRFLKESPAVFKDYKFMKNTDFHFKILLRKCLTVIMNKLV